MNEFVGRLAGSLVSVGKDLTTEFEARLADSGTLAVRVAYGVLRNRADAEDVAQEAFVRAFRRFAAFPPSFEVVLLPATSDSDLRASRCRNR